MIQRYGFNGACDGESGRCLENMMKSDDGDYVHYDDHIAEVERLRHDIERHMALLAEFVNRAEKAEAEVELLRSALKSTEQFLHYCWCDVQMNEYAFQKLQEQMKGVNAAIEGES